MPEIKGSLLAEPLISSTLPADPGGGKRIRTADPLLAKQVLFQLSYTPVTRFLQQNQGNLGGPR